MGNCRILYNNFITSEDMLAASSLRNGNVLSALKKREDSVTPGAATMATSGLFSASADKEYIVECDSIAAGAEVGQATIRWSDGGGTWNATGVPASSSPTLLADGVYITFASGTGADFVVGDRWYFKAVNLFNPGKMLNLDRDDRYRSKELTSPNRITITFTSPQTPLALIIYDHNLTGSATITLRDSTGALSESVTWTSGKILHYIAAPAAYTVWYLDITDPANTDGYIEIGELYLGSYLVLTNNYSYGESIELSFIEDLNKTSYGVEREQYGNMLEKFTLEFVKLTDTDVTALRTMLNALADRLTRRRKPVYFNRDLSTPSDVLLAKITSFEKVNTFVDQNTVTVGMCEVARSV